MTPVPSASGELQYDIAVHSADHQLGVYRTSELLSNAGSRYVQGRATRVWAARKIDPVTGEPIGGPVVLKDAWVDSHREREGDTVARIRQAASSMPGNDRTRLDDALLTVIFHGDLTIADRPDRTRVLPTETAQRKQHVHPAASKTSQTHYRIIFQELCTPLREVTSLSTIFEALANACEGAFNAGTGMSPQSLISDRRVSSHPPLWLGPRRHEHKQHSAPRRFGQDIRFGVCCTI